MKHPTRLIINAFAVIKILSLSACGSPEQKFSITVLDENDKPLEGVICSAGFYRDKSSGIGLEPYQVSGESDSSGRVDLVGKTVFFETSVKAKMDGYYDSLIERQWITDKNDYRWGPWPVEVDLVMKKIQNPQPMYVCKFDGQKWLSFPDGNLGPLGFDLMEADWVHPHGRGKVADFVIKAERESADDIGVMPKGHVALTFSNDEDGVFLVKDKSGSVLSGPSVVPSDQNFKNQWKFDNHKLVSNEKKAVSNSFSDEVYIFRIRTEVTGDGRVVSAYYGKISGRIVGWLPQAAPSILMTYYLAGKANDRGLEWDMKNNLIEDRTRMRTPERP